MTTLEKDIEKYLYKVRSCIVCDKETRKKLIEEIEESIYEYAEHKGITDINEIHQKFGTPEMLANTYLSQIEPSKVIKAVKRKNTAVVAVVVVLIMLAVSLIISLFDAHKSYYPDRKYGLTNSHIQMSSDNEN